MPLSMSFDIAQVLDITGEEEHLTELINVRIRQRGGVLEEEIDDLIFEVLGDLCAHLKDPRPGRSPGAGHEDGRPHLDRGPPGGGGGLTLTGEKVHWFVMAAAGMADVLNKQCVRRKTAMRRIVSIYRGVENYHKCGTPLGSNHVERYRCVNCGHSRQIPRIQVMKKRRGRMVVISSTSTATAAATSPRTPTRNESRRTAVCSIRGRTFVVGYRCPHCGQEVAY